MKEKRHHHKFTNYDTPVCVNSVRTIWIHAITFTGEHTIKGRENDIILKLPTMTLQCVHSPVNVIAHSQGSVEPVFSAITCDCTFTGECTIKEEKMTSF